MMSYNKNKPETIQAMFGSIAPQYDRTNNVVSFQLCKLWNKQLIKSVMESSQGYALADLCCGTGAIGLTHLRNTQEPCEAYLIDFCKEMLSYAAEKARDLPANSHKITYLQADVQEIPLADRSIDSATMAYGIRNVQNPTKCLDEVYRILKYGGKFGILELTEPTNPLLRVGHKLYLKTVLPLLGKVLTSNEEAYRYLCNSIHSFIKPKELAAIMRESGFKNIQIKPLHGGIATIILGHKKALSDE